MGNIYTLYSIGEVKNGVTDIAFKGWSDLISQIIVDDEYTQALDGLEEFSHLFIIYWFHQPGEILLKRHPRDRLDLPLTGLFATRTQYRPNRIALTAVRLLARNGNELKVAGLDAIDGTPVIDIKPYIPRLDIVAEAKVPVWVDKLQTTGDKS